MHTKYGGVFYALLLVQRELRMSPCVTWFNSFSPSSRVTITTRAINSLPDPRDAVLTPVNRAWARSARRTCWRRVTKSWSWCWSTWGGRPPPSPRPSTGPGPSLATWRRLWPATGAGRRSHSWWWGAAEVEDQVSGILQHFKLWYDFCYVLKRVRLFV